MTLDKLHKREEWALGTMQRANECPGGVMRMVALGSLDRYHGMIEAMGRRYSPELWNAVNPLDKRRCQP